jgi:hypothetical protein
MQIGVAPQRWLAVRRRIVARTSTSKGRHSACGVESRRRDRRADGGGVLLLSFFARLDRSRRMNSPATRWV